MGASKGEPYAQAVSTSFPARHGEPNVGRGKCFVSGPGNLCAGADSSQVEAPGLNRRWLIDGVDSVESDRLQAANKRIRTPEQELQLVKDASELFDAPGVVPQEPAGCCRRTSSPRPFGSFRHSGIWGEQVNFWLPNTTLTAG